MKTKKAYGYVTVAMSKAAHTAFKRRAAQERRTLVVLMDMLAGV